MQRLRRGKITLMHGHIPQVAQHAGDALLISQFPCDRQALLVEHPGKGQVGVIAVLGILLLVVSFAVILAVQRLAGRDVIGTRE